MFYAKKVLICLLMHPDSRLLSYCCFFKLLYLYLTLFYRGDHIISSVSFGNMFDHDAICSESFLVCGCHLPMVFPTHFPLSWVCWASGGGSQKGSANLATVNWFCHYVQCLNLCNGSWLRNCDTIGFLLGDEHGCGH